MVPGANGTRRRPAALWGEHAGVRRGRRRRRRTAPTLKALKLALGIGLSAALLLALGWNLEWRELGRLLAATRWEWVAATAVLAVAGPWARARRWRYLFPAGANPPDLLPGTMIGYMANSLLPLRAGEVVRVWVVARRWRVRGTGDARWHPFWTTLATLAVERVLDALAVVLILAGLVLLVPVPRALEIAAAALLVADLAAMGALATLALKPALGDRLVARIVRRWPRLERRARVALQTFAGGLDGARAPGHALPLLAWTVGIWLVGALGCWTMFRALDLTLPWLAGWAVLAFVGLGVSVPSAPGYVGVFHAAAVWALAIFAVPATAAVGYALLLHAAQLVAITLVGWGFLLREHVSLAEAVRGRSD